MHYGDLKLKAISGAKDHRMVLINKGDVVAYGTVEEMQKSRHPKVRQFLDRIPEPAVAQELDYLQMLTEPQSMTGNSMQGKSR